ncbi:MAG: acyl-CoA dehydratase activase-related protein [Prevotellaceae bacterium]|jgi:predicted CoA-substrate-specific enzyme activase|nr:acyl-CoA dehydratase activase-related protein [Prevotellaceae bacterium]
MNIETTYKVGIDVGSTTLKIIVLDERNEIVHKIYRRHKADIQVVFAEELAEINRLFPSADFRIAVSGSAGMGIAERTGIAFVQEIVAAIEVVKNHYADTHTLIDLGGEDSKMVFFEDGKQPDIRMNGSCAGGTGAFIDQMADLMHTPVEELGKQALRYEKIYPVASRCGVFAKTDVQNLISRNIAAPDVSMSILQTVALQSITSLARGRDILPKVLCIGGPLTFLKGLRDSFQKLLKVSENELILPENSEYFPAWGAALLSLPCHSDKPCSIADIIEKSKVFDSRKEHTLAPLFNNVEEFSEWKSNRHIKKLKFKPLSFCHCGLDPQSPENKGDSDFRQNDRKQQGIAGHTSTTLSNQARNDGRLNLFLGIDSGSTTTKILILDEDENIVYQYYQPNAGNPLKTAVEGLQKFYDEAAEKDVSFRFVASCATGYGEDLIKSALGLDYGIVETMAHLQGAQYVDSEVSFILDIGGQDMKSIFVDRGVIAKIELNEACSSGCGSFLQNFASTMNLTLAQFTEQACLAAYPCDLGSRCTVFMNSKVKQSLRENATIGDIAAGLAYSVVKNCLFKVLKIANLNQLGEHIVVQGGTFRNDAVYRALELLSDKKVSSTDYPELMGALGAALYARHRSQEPRAKTQDISLPDVTAIQTKKLQCKGCTNQCEVIRFGFENGNISYAGNKCEKVFFNKNSAKGKGYNAFDFKNEILFSDRQSSDKNFAEMTGKKMTIGIPRALNMYENFPFWQTLLTECGFEVLLSPESDFSLYHKGAGSVMSENICFPAKLVHGHIQALMEARVDRIFYPIVPKDEKEFRRTTNSYNCPVVSGYPDVIKSAIDPEGRHDIPFDQPVIHFGNEKALRKGCKAYLVSLNVDKKTFKQAFKKALEERERVKNELRDTQKALLDKAICENRMAFVVAGRPYHADGLINQKVGQILSDLGVDVFTDDVFRKEGAQVEQSRFDNLNLVSQWSYPNRVVQAALEVARLPQNVQLVQLNSFGCGPDSFYMDEVGEILKQAGKNHTLLRIDEITSSGSVRLRLRSLVESLLISNSSGNTPAKNPYQGYKIPYTEEDKKKTILIPWFADFLSPFIPAIGELAGYKVQNVPKTSKKSVEVGLKYGHNEVCYPSTLVLGDLICALQSGEYDINDVVLAVTQTGGQCRATNYVAQLKAGLTNAGFSGIPIVVVSTGEVFQNEQSAFTFPYIKLANIIINTILYADALQQMRNSTIIREQQKGEAQRIFDLYIERGIEAVRVKNSKRLLKLLEQAVTDFNQIPILDRHYTKVGLIGEIYIKYNNYGQTYITEWLQSQNMEVVTPPILDFFMQYFVNSKTDIKNGIKKNNMLEHYLSPILWKMLNKKTEKIEKIVRNYRFFHPSKSVYEKSEYASEILDLSHQFGEGWLIAAEVACYARDGINRVVCIQPFGCIANHIVAKGIEKRIKKFYPNVNLLYLDIDSGVADVNLQNRLHFLIN